MLPVCGAASSNRIRPQNALVDAAGFGALLCFGFSAALMLQRWQGPSSVASSEVTSKVHLSGEHRMVRRTSR